MGQFFFYFHASSHRLILIAIVGYCRSRPASRVTGAAPVVPIPGTGEGAMPTTNNSGEIYLDRRARYQAAIEEQLNTLSAPTSLEELHISKLKIPG